MYSLRIEYIDVDHALTIPTSLPQPTMVYSEKAVDLLVRDYRDEFGVCISYDDAIRMMMLVDMLSEVFEKYGDEVGDDMPAFLAPILGF
jgi:hypothetical protein